MPPLSQAEIEKFRDLLRQRQTALRQAIDEEVLREEREDYKSILGRVRDTGDEALADLIADSNIAGLNRFVEEFRDISAALERMQTGGYGTCNDCGADIDISRLEVYPTAKRCMPCQRQHEATFAGKSTPSL